MTLPRTAVRRPSIDSAWTVMEPPRTCRGLAARPATRALAGALIPAPCAWLALRAFAVFERISKPTSESPPGGKGPRQELANRRDDAVLRIVGEPGGLAVEHHRPIDFVAALGNQPLRRHVERDVVGVGVDPEPRRRRTRASAAARNRRRPRRRGRPSPRLSPNDQVWIG